MPQVLRSVRLTALAVAFAAPLALAQPTTTAPPESGIVGTLPGLPPNGLTGQAPGDQFGRVVANAGDVNGDGYDDVLVGAAGNDAGGTDAGRAYLYLGGPSMTNDPAKTLTGAAPGDYFGTSVAGAGDVNGDGFADLIVGATGNDAGGANAGRAYVYFGGPAMDTVPDVTLTGAAVSDFFGYAVAGVGDVNGDGYDDVSVGAPLHDSGGVDRGRVYVFFGGAAMNNGADATPRGQFAGDQFGRALAGAGDVDGDGYDDVLVGAPYNDAAGNLAGRAYVVLGGAAMDSSLDVVLTGQAAGDQFGDSVSGAGDLSGDGLADVVVGAFGNDAGGADSGRAYVYFGGTVMNNVVDVTLTGSAPGGWFGLAVAGAGDVDADGYDDLLVGAPLDDAFAATAGSVRVYRGGPASPGGPAFDSTPDAVVYGRAASDALGFGVAGGGDVDGDGRSDVLAGAYGYDGGRGRVAVAGVRLAGEDLPDEFYTGEAVTFGSFGVSVSGAGDVNGDGYDDVVVGAYGANGGTGAAYVHFGGPGADTVPDVTMFGVAGSDNFGDSVSGAGDVNGDGYDDVLVGAYLNDAGGTDAGRAYVFFGGAAMNNVADVTITGVAAGDRLGVSVSGAGDVNGDGYDDVLVGAHDHDAAGLDAGQAYVFFGGAAMNAVADVTITGVAAGDEFGVSVAGAGDVNGDGYDDVIVGAHLNDAGGSNAGRAYVYFGGAAMNNAADVTMTGAAAGDNFGFSVAGAGDVNGDGYDDVLVGALWGDEDGRAYVYLGAPSTDGVPDVTLTGQAFGDAFGISVAGAGDVNGDGYDDVLVGATDHDAGGSNAGRAYVYFGGVAMNSVADVTMTGAVAGDRLATSVAGAGDVDGDGAADVLVGSPGHDAPGVTNSGRATLYRSTYPAVAPRLAAVRDVPDDQGGFVTAEWTASAYDVSGVAHVSGYLVERSRADGPPAWEPVTTVAATRNRRYSAVVPTYGVPAEGTSQPARVRVTAVTAQPDEFWRSAVVSGASVDNIAPPAPLDPVAAPDGSAIRLTWTAPSAPDLDSYAVYRSATSGFTPDSTTFLATVDGMAFTDADAGAWFYRVSARDASGNEGAPSAEASATVVAGEDGPPSEFALASPSPNPASGAVTVRIALPVASDVRVTVVDVVGREVARLADGPRAPGWHAVPLDARRLAAGTYVVRMEAGPFSATRRLSVVR